MVDGLNEQAYAGVPTRAGLVLYEQEAAISIYKGLGRFLEQK